MGRFYKAKAIKHFGRAGFGRWMLDDGDFLDIQQDDHRIIGCCCSDEWRDAIKDGCISIHFGRLSRNGLELWIRHSNTGINLAQRREFEDILYGGSVTYFHANVYDFSSGVPVIEEEIEIDNNPDLVKLYLTDPIAYRMEKELHDELEG